MDFDVSRVHLACDDLRHDDTWITMDHNVSSRREHDPMYHNVSWGIVGCRSGDSGVHVLRVDDTCIIICITSFFCDTFVIHCDPMFDELANVSEMIH